MDAEVDTELMQNVFDNLWRFDDKLNIVPDIATAVPTQANGGISADGLTYTIHLNPAAKFSNGDAVTSKDVLYSWNRGVALHGAYSSILSAIQGYAAVQTAAGAPPSSGTPTTFQGNIEKQLAAGNSAFMMSGLTAPDPETVQVKLGTACGWCLTAWTLEGTVGAIVDEKVINAPGVDPVNWWQTPANLVGTGAYKLTAYTPKQSLTFSAVPNWWGIPEAHRQDDQHRHQGSVDRADDRRCLLPEGATTSSGTAATAPSSRWPTSSRSRRARREKPDLLTQPKGRTTWVSFSIGYPTGGPFQGETAAAKGLRLAFDLAVDKKGLATTVCHNVICSAATGGLITTGLIGNGGPNSDPLAKFDATKAKSLLAAVRPVGLADQEPDLLVQRGQPQRERGHVPAERVADQPRRPRQPQRRVGRVDLHQQPPRRASTRWTVTAGSSTTTIRRTGTTTSGVSTPRRQAPTPVASTTRPTTASSSRPTPSRCRQALPLYNQLAQILQNDVVYIPLYYSVGNFLIQPYVSGAGSNTAFDHYWNEIKILAH